MAIFAKKQDKKGLEGQAGVGTQSAEVEPAVTEPAVVGPTLVGGGSIGAAAVVETAAADPAAVEPTDTAAASDQPVIGAAAAGPSTETQGAAATTAPPADIEAEDIEPEPAFGIADAIQLMRSLPTDPNMDLVVRVVRVTLGAVNVSVEEIMEDARRKEKRIQDNIALLDGQVAELEKQVYIRRCEIAAHQADLKETASVRERLYQADKYNGHRPPSPPPFSATRVPPVPKPGEWETSDRGKRE